MTGRPRPSPEPLLHARIRPADLMTTPRVSVAPAFIACDVFLIHLRPRTCEPFDGCLSLQFA
ncbi:MAG TPA: hypothetical protein DCG14_10615 [Phycisphaerales bacterium]|nr:hypothetical protein [Phycisphaerales bacterium]